MVLAELTGDVTVRLQKLGDGRVFGAHSLRGGGDADLGEAGAVAGLPCDKRGASRGTGLLAIRIREPHSFLGDTIDVGRLIAHETVRITTQNSQCRCHRPR